LIRKWKLKKKSEIQEQKGDVGRLELKPDLGQEHSQGPILERRQGRNKEVTTE
jgi:hypothetical protein